VTAGERVALLGPNGSGKSTLIGLLAGLQSPRAGTVRVLGGDPVRGDARFRRRTAVALDRPAHWEALTGRENALLLASALGLGEDHARARVERLLELFSLTQDADVPVGEYSLGMRRKLLLLEALTGDPEVILMDEPTLGLDPPAVDALGDELEDGWRHRLSMLLGLRAQDGDTCLQIRGLDVGDEPPLKTRPKSLLQ